MRAPRRDPETRRSIRRLEDRLSETLSVEEGKTILHKLIALYSELGDARGVIRYRTQLQRFEAIEERSRSRASRKTGRAPRGARTSRRATSQGPRTTTNSTVDPNVLWTNGEVYLERTKLHDYPYGVYRQPRLDHEPVDPQLFSTREQADAYAFTRYGVYTRSNDPDGRTRRAKRSRRRPRRDPERRKRAKRVRRLHHARRIQRATNLRRIETSRQRAREELMEAHEMEKEATRLYSLAKNAPRGKDYDRRLAAARHVLEMAMERKARASRLYSRMPGSG